MTDVKIPEGITRINFQLFYGCSSLTSITIPKSVTQIDYEAFSGCSSLKSITISENVTDIGNSAFANCYGLNSITIPGSVRSIGDYAFGGTNLIKVIWLTNTPPYGYKDVHGIWNYVSNEQYSEFNNKTVYPFLSSMFEVDGIRYVPVSPSERICDAIDCVYGSTAANINISSEITYKGIAMKVRNILPFLCYDNDFIENLNCNCLGDIGQSAFARCNNIKSLALGENISAIAHYAFEDCCSLQSVVIPNSIKTLEEGAFSGCTSLTSVLIGSQIKELGSYSFWGCSSLKDVTIGSHVERIGDNAFANCQSLPLLRIPYSVKSISDDVFKGCKGLKTVIVEDRDAELSLGRNTDNSLSLFVDCPLDSIYIGGNISYATSPFYCNTSLRTVVITDKETEISPNMFYGCTNLQNFTVGDGVTKIDNWAFSGCSSLKSLSFGSKLKTIGKEAFSDCGAVTKIVSKTATPPICGSQALDDINKWNCMLYVPEGSMSSYQSAEQWKEFFFVEEGNGTESPEVPQQKKCAQPSIRYANGQLVFDCETEGASFVITQSRVDAPSTGEVTGSLMDFVPVCTLSFYAKADGYEDSDIVTQTVMLGSNGDDIDGDGILTVSDITALIDLYLEDKAQ